MTDVLTNEEFERLWAEHLDPNRETIHLRGRDYYKGNKTWAVMQELRQFYPMGGEQA